MLLLRKMNQTTEVGGVSPVKPQHMMRDEENNDDWDLIHHDGQDDEIPINTVKTVAWSFNFDNYSSMMVSEITLPEIIDEDEDEDDNDFIRDSTSVVKNDDDDDSMMKAFQNLPLFQYDNEDDDDSDPFPLIPSKSLKCGLQRILPIEKELDFDDDDDDDDDEDGSYDSNFENDVVDTTRA